MDLSKRFCHLYYPRLCFWKIIWKPIGKNLAVLTKFSATTRKIFFHFLSNERSKLLHSNMQLAFLQSPVWAAAAPSARAVNVSVTPCVCTMEAAVQTITLCAQKRVSTAAQQHQKLRRQMSFYECQLNFDLVLSRPWWHLPGPRGGRDANDPRRHLDPGSTSFKLIWGLHNSLSASDSFHH